MAQKKAYIAHWINQRDKPLKPKLFQIIHGAIGDKEK